MSMHPRLRNMVIRRLGTGRGGQGVEITFTRRVPGGYDPVTGGNKPPTNTDYIGSGVRVNYSEYAYKDESIVYGDFQIYLSPVLKDGTECPTPELSDVLNFLGRKVKVINVKPFNDNGYGCGWKLQVRYG